MWSREISIGNASFFLFGPRGVGKSTLLSTKIGKAKKVVSLLKQAEYLKYLQDTSAFTREVLAEKQGTWIILDKIQRIPALLDSVHDIMNEKGEKYYKFAITGSSARKLKRSHANLLAGRALNRKLFPLIHGELKFAGGEIQDILSFGTLPAVRNLSGSDRVGFLESYVATYLEQEVQQEAFAKNLDSFVRFLKVAAAMNGQIVNVSGLARDSGVARTSVQGYFDVLIDTLVGTWLPAWQPKARVKETQHPKFYFFDTGVVRTLTSMLRDPLDSVERGFLLETYLFHELRANIEYQGVGGELGYWRTDKRELDFIWKRGKRSIGIEVKSSARWRKEYSDVGRALLEDKVIDAVYGVYLGNEKLQDGKMRVYPLILFLEALSRGEILNSSGSVE